MHWYGEESNDGHESLQGNSVVVGAGNMMVTEVSNAEVENLNALVVCCVGENDLAWWEIEYDMGRCRGSIDLSLRLSHESIVLNAR